MNDATTAFARTLVDEWSRAGVTDAVVSPGSRSAPLALALARDGCMRVHVVLDERSAAFRALGIGLASGRPAVVLCTSGTAAANFHPAVVEAHHARVPMLVCTADRPPELRDVGAGQTIDQHRLYGGAVRWFCDPGSPDPDTADAGPRWRALAARAFIEANGPPAGPVHCNLPFREPLVPTDELGAPGRADGRPWVVATPARRLAAAADIARVAGLVREHPRGLLVAGWGAGVTRATAARFTAAAGWPVLADPISQLRSGPHAVSTYEALLRADEYARAHRPDVVVRVGAPLTSKVATAWLDEVAVQLLVDPDRAWLDPGRGASEQLAVDAEPFLEAVAHEAPGADSPWLDEWMRAERAARHAMDRVLDATAAPFEGQVARDLARALPDGATLVAASSLPVRALEWCMAPRDGIRVLANRGANGIDGFVSTVLGVATGTTAPVVGFAGDLCFLHDCNGLLGAGVSPPATFVVVDNDGGGIFSFLPQHGLPEFELLFGTPHGLDLVAVARAHGVAAERVDDVAKFANCLEDALTAGETRVLVVPVDREASVARHRAIWDEAARALRDESKR
jgi:2-succinyl-5-enolpyruvyl-6-hydroxy-3-cyclohexene-1-carboxylate synthase